MSTIPIRLEESTESQSGTLGVLTPGSVIKHVSADKIRESLVEFSGQISQVLQDIKAVGDFKLKEVQLSVEITAEGGVALIGKAEVGAKGAMTLTFAP
ncbi:hypothetical protein HYR99_16745 [Candidatus Poribacteria bacterium]|nr:hypothetical protein [Candidatus Poribacteria bacterium]